MASEENKAIARRAYEELFNHGKVELADTLFAESFVAHEPNPLPNQPLRGPEAVRWYVSFLRDAFSDFTITIDDMLAEGEEVAVRFTTTGRHTGQFAYLAPTGRRVHVVGIDVLRFENGKITAHWGGWNRAELMVQLGLFPTTEGTLA